MRQFVRLLIIIITIAILVGITYLLVTYNARYIEENPSSQTNNEVKQDDNNTIDKSEVTLESKESIEKYAQEEKDNIINEIKSTINMNIIANVRKTTNKKILKSNYGEITTTNLDTSGEDSGEQNEVKLPDSISCIVQVAGSMINVVPEDDGLDSFEFHYRGDNKLVAYVRKFAGTNIKATYYFENGELLGKEVNSFDTRYVTNEDTQDILKRADIFYNEFLKED